MVTVDREWLEIDRDSIPYSIYVDLRGTIIQFEFHYNTISDSFTVNLSDQDGGIIVEGKRIVYGADLLSSIVDDRLPPTLAIVPMDDAGMHQDITWNNISDIKLFFVWGD